MLAEQVDDLGRLSRCQVTTLSPKVLDRTHDHPRHPLVSFLRSAREQETFALSYPTMAIAGVESDPEKTGGLGLGWTLASHGL